MEVQLNWHHHLLIDRLMALYRGDIRRLLVCVPPRSLKSFICSVAYPAWLLGQDPGLAIVNVCYSQPLATGFARQCRAGMESAFYKQTFATRVSPDNRRADDFTTTRGGRRIATSIEGTLTGQGGGLIIVDDPMKGQDAYSETARENVLEFHQGTMLSRLDSKQYGRILVVMQRLHENDLAGSLIEQGGWVTLILPAIALTDEVHHYRTLMGPVVKRRLKGEALHPERESLAVLEELRVAMGDLRFGAQYQQNPTPIAGNLVKRSWFGDSILAPSSQFDATLLSIDTASSTAASADWSVVIVCGVIDDDIHIRDVIRVKVPFHELTALVQELINQWKPDRVLIENAGTGQSLVQCLIADGVGNVRAISVTQDKNTRMAGASPLIYAGRVKLPLDALWRTRLLDEICAFPAGEHDDQADALSQLLNHIRDEPPLSPLMRRFRDHARDLQIQARTIRVNHADKSLVFKLCTGRVADREADGSFLVTPEEYSKLQIPNVWRMHNDRRDMGY